MCPSPPSTNIYENVGSHKKYSQSGYMKVLFLFLEGITHHLPIMRCAYVLRYKIDIQRFFSWSAIDYPICHLYLLRIHAHSRPQRPRSFWSAPRIATSGQVQRHSGFEWLCKHNRLRLEPIRLVILNSEHAQSDRKSVYLADFRCWTLPEVAILGADRKRGLWDENDTLLPDGSCV